MNVTISNNLLVPMYIPMATRYVFLQSLKIVHNPESILQTEILKWYLFNIKIFPKCIFLILSNFQPK
jgi:hypothetical protein